MSKVERLTLFPLFIFIVTNAIWEVVAGFKPAPTNSKGYFHPYSIAGDC